MTVGRIIARVGRFLLHVLLLLGVLELCARGDDWLKWGAPFWETYSPENLSVADSLGWHNRPGARFEKWRINSHGFRGMEIAKEKPDGIIRVVVVGASESFGLFESEDMEYPAQLQQVLDVAAPGRFEVLNAATPGMSPPRIRFYYDKWLTGFEPDILLYYPSPSFYLLRQPPSEVLQTPDQPAPPGFAFRLTGKARAAIKRFLPQQLQVWMKRIVIDRAVAGHDPDWVFAEVPADRADIFRRQLSNLVSEIHDSGVKVIMATHCNSVSDEMNERDRRVLTGWRKMYPHVAELTFLKMEELGNRVILETGEAYGASVVDLSAILGTRPAYFADHVHFTDAGARAVAEALAAEVLRISDSLTEGREMDLPPVTDR